VGLACVFAGPLAFAKTPEQAPAGNTIAAPSEPASSEPSDVSNVEKWTQKEWDNETCARIALDGPTLL